MIDLQQFCGADDFRPYLQKPFRRNGYVYATDGRILLRVDDDEQYSTVEKVNTERVFEKISAAVFVPAPSVNIPPKAPISERECRDCDGRGTEHDCPDCGCECDTCDGTGRIKDQPEISTSLCGHLFNVDYIRLMFTLPDLEIAPSQAQIVDGHSALPMFFRFAGGVGALMPLSRQYEKHVEIEGIPAVAPQGGA